MNDINININQQNSKDIVNNDEKNKVISKWGFAENSFLVVVLFGVFFSVYYCSFYLLVASIWSGFLGSFAFKIHFIKDKEGKDLNYKDFSWQVILHQFIFNFVAALFGWFILWFLFVYKDLSLDALKTPQVLLLGVAIVSLSGYLPSIISKGNPFK